MVQKKQSRKKTKTIKAEQFEPDRVMFMIVIISVLSLVFFGMIGAL